jgi:hypothetical protein
MANDGTRRQLLLIRFLAVILILIISGTFFYSLPSPDSTTVTNTSTQTSSPTATPTTTQSSTPMPVNQPPTVVARFFTVQNQPNDEPIYGGFRISNEQLDPKFDSFYGRSYDSNSFFAHFGINSGEKYAEVRAECWEGSLISRPTNDSYRVGFRQDVRRGEDTFVVGQIPNRPDVTSGQVSCLFGFQNTSADMYAGTNNQASINVRLGENITVTRSEIRNRPQATLVTRPFADFPEAEHPVRSFHEDVCEAAPRPETCQTVNGTST